MAALVPPSRPAEAGAAAESKRQAYEAAMGYYFKKKEKQKQHDEKKGALEEAKKIPAANSRHTSLSLSDSIKKRREAISLKSGLFGDLAFGSVIGGDYTLDLHLAVSTGTS